jgi:hypothetical protein
MKDLRIFRVNHKRSGIKASFDLNKEGFKLFKCGNVRNKVSSQVVFH